MNQARAGMTPRLIDSLYTEAMLLADEARAYFDRHGREDRMSLDPLLRVGFSVESLKVTTRLMHVIAWLLTRRAIETGEIAAGEGGAVGLGLGPAPPSDSDLMERLPDAALQLVRASQDLFARVQRLEECGRIGEPAHSPARTLLSRLERAF